MREVHRSPSVRPFEPGGRGPVNVRLTPTEHLGLPREERRKGRADRSMLPGSSELALDDPREVLEWLSSRDKLAVEKALQSLTFESESQITSSCLVIPATALLPSWYLFHVHVKRCTQRRE